MPRYADQKRSSCLKSILLLCKSPSSTFLTCYLKIKTRIKKKLINFCCKFAKKSGSMLVELLGFFTSHPICLHQLTTSRFDFFYNFFKHVYLLDVSVNKGLNTRRKFIYCLKTTFRMNSIACEIYICIYTHKIHTNI